MIINKIYRYSKGIRANKREYPVMIGVCGGISCGKTTISKGIIRNISYNCGRIFNADIHAKNALKDTYIKAQILNKYSFLRDKANNNEIDKASLRKWVLENKNNIVKLEKFIHPYVSKQSHLFLQWCRRNRFKWIIWDIPLLWEAKYSNYCHKIICLKVSLKTRRLRSSKKMNSYLFNFLLSRQNSNHEQQKKSDYVINNNGSKIFTRNEFKKLLLLLVKNKT